MYIKTPENYKSDYQYLLFDLDGTLTDPFDGITKSFQYALQAYGIDANQSELNFVIGPPLIDSFCGVYGFDKETGTAAVEKYRERFRTIGWKENKIIDGVPEMLEKLKTSGKILALATSKPYIFAEKILDLFDISKYFDVVIGAELDGSISAKNQVIEKCLSALGNPDRKYAIMIGDRKYDILGAKDCNIASMGVRIGYASENELEDSGADFIADSIEDLESFFL